MTAPSIVEFLLARLAEAEESARSAAGDERHQQWALNESGDLNEGYIVAQALWRLADIEAKRRIIEECDDEIRSSPWSGAVGQDLAEKTLRLLALPDDQYPDYQPEWRP